MKCPRCDKVLSHLNAAKIDTVDKTDQKHSAVAYLCPHCDVIVGMTTDPDRDAGWVPKEP